MRLIDADELLTAFPVDDEPTLTKACVRMTTQHMPTIEPEPHWIPVTERLPKKHGETYIVTISKGAVYSAALQWDANRKRWYLSFLNDGNILVDFIDDVTAWMPIPEPYEGEQD